MKIKKYFRFIDTETNSTELAMTDGEKVCRLGPCETIDAFFDLIQKASWNPLEGETFEAFLEGHGLATPIVEPEHHLALALNYHNHVEETQLASRPLPIVFPRKCSPTPWNQAIQLTGTHVALLDYEVEWAIVLKKDINAAEARSITKDNAIDYIAGVVLALDMTARDEQVLFYRPGNPYYGFSIAKSHSNYAPLGQFFVKWQDFEQVDDFSFNLKVNGELKQQGSLQGLIVDPIHLIQHFYTPEVVERKYKATKGKDINVLTKETLRKGDLILMGTPAGILFEPPSGGQKVTGFFKGLFKGSPIKGMKQFIIDNQPPHLQIEDQIEAESPLLGRIRLKIL